MKLVISICFIIHALTPSLLAQSSYKGRGWKFSNEKHSANIFHPDGNAQKKLVRPSDGIYLSIGSDRAFNGATMAAEAGAKIKGVLAIDRDPEVLETAKFLASSAQSSKDLWDFNARVANSYFDFFINILK